jgi:hypothetical protein
MALIPCPECKREISSAASACPHCGFSNPATAAPPAPNGPACHACAAPATAKCQRCGTPACVAHIESIHLYFTRANELRCKKCYERGDANNAAFKLFGVFFLVLWIVGVVIAVTRIPTGR